MEVSERTTRHKFKCYVIRFVNFIYSPSQIEHHQRIYNQQQGLPLLFGAVSTISNLFKHRYQSKWIMGAMFSNNDATYGVPGTIGTHSTSTPLISREPTTTTKSARSEKAV